MAIIEDNSYGPNSAKFFQEHLGKGGFVPSRPVLTSGSKSTSGAPPATPSPVPQEAREQVDEIKATGVLEQGKEGSDDK
ncbi:MAG: hypothetical protein AB7U43_05585 [Desulfobacter sp.]